MSTPRTKTRDIARSAVREELAEVAFGVFCRDGFEKATFDDLAAAAGVSRSTFLRYFGTKEEVVLCAFDPLGDEMTAALRARPADEDDWTALRRAIDPAVACYARDPADKLALLRLVQATPALCARLREKVVGWRPHLARALAERSGASPLAALVRVAAALDCLTLALEHWVELDGGRALDAITDEAFASLTVARGRHHELR
ncbi:TetR family transcriptional regulator [Acrocarpospora phusangensis]|uniref:TetR family transcriptional regulator n=1 Tax=Acrocarpospora phusangensis TaxID=1070424 RepID=A0A919QAR2_9ACTN|nr:TetR/AcrR family transcriptional regulator [Acrocarpospora phusangensis]GIH23938.1 TetR family transcriptional regulator [Acrocarpospora phusangensis]